MKSFWMLALCALCGWASAQEKDLIAHFTFDNDTPPALKSTDGKYVFKSRNQKNPDFSSVEFVKGVHGKALYLKEGNLIHYCLPQGVLTDFKPPFTIALWVKRTAVHPKHRHGVLCGTCADSTSFGFEFSWFSRMAMLRWGDGKENSVSTPEGSLTLNKWHHLAVTHDGKVVTIYVDTIPLAVRNVQTPFVAVPENKKFANRFTLGQYPTNFSAYAHIGMLDDLFLFSRALTQEEIASLATSQSEVAGQPFLSPRPGGQ